MRICPKCGHENRDEADFCADCGEYIRWEATVLVPVVSAPQPAAPAAPPADAQQPSAPPPAEAPQAPTPDGTRRYSAVEPAAPQPPAPAPHVPAESVVIALRRPEDQSATGGPVTAKSEPGGQAVIYALVRNQSGIVDNYDLYVSGLPDGWWTVTPSTVYLVPFGASGGGYEQEVEIRFNPPRSPEAHAREWPVQVTAVSKAHDTVVGSADATLAIAPYLELETEVRPERGGGRRKAKFAIAVRNKANAPVEVGVSALDSEGNCKFKFERERLTAEPGQRVGTPFTVRPPKPIIIGRPVDRRFEVSAQPVGAVDGRIPRPVVFRHKPWLPWWLPLALPMIIAGVIALWFLFFNKTHVPNVIGSKCCFAAEKKFKDAGLKLGEKQEVTVNDRQLIGTILNTAPAPGKKVKKGTDVTIQVGIGTGLIQVPNVVGKTLIDAENQLQQLGLTDVVLPSAPEDPAKVVVKNQTPPQGRSVKEGQAVKLYVLPAKKGGGGGTTGGGTTGGTTGSTNGGKGGGGGGGPKIIGGSIVIPALLGLTGVKAALAAIQGKHLLPQIVKRFSEQPAGTLLGQIPKAGTKAEEGDTVQVLVSAGPLFLAFSDGTTISLTNALTGGAQRPLIAAPGFVAEQPAWRPKGRYLAYRQGPATNRDAGEIWVVDTQNPATKARLTQGPNDRRPTFSPDGRVIAFAHADAPGPTVDKDLCFVKGDGSLPFDPRRDCIRDPSVDVDRPAWSPDGKTILVTAHSQSDPNQIELLAYATQRASSGSPRDWGPLGVVTDKKHGTRSGDRVLFAAWAPPDGKRIAIVANWRQRTTSFVVFLAPWGLTGLGAPKPTQFGACEVDWRPDGVELMVTKPPCDPAGGGGFDRILLPSMTVRPLLPDTVRNPAFQRVDLSGG